MKASTLEFRFHLSFLCLFQSKKKNCLCLFCFFYCVNFCVLFYFYFSSYFLSSFVLFVQVCSFSFLTFSLVFLFYPIIEKEEEKFVQKKREKRKLSKKSFGLKERKKKLQKNDSVQYCASNYLLHNKKKKSVNSFYILFHKSVTSSYILLLTKFQLWSYLHCWFYTPFFDFFYKKISWVPCCYVYIFLIYILLLKNVNCGLICIVGSIHLSLIFLKKISWVSCWYVYIVLVPQSYYITILYCFLLSRIILKGS